MECWIPIQQFSSSAGSDWARDAGEVDGEVLELPPLTSENEEKCSGGETRTLNLAEDQDEDPEQHQLE